MKFIIWTLVWFGLEIIERTIEYKFGGYKSFHKRYSKVLGLASLTSYIMYIVLYLNFIK